MAKDSDAFRTISEVAEDLRLPQHVLRFWETRFPQIRPLKRAGGRRYYRPADVALLRTIQRLLYDDGYTIKGVQRLFKDRSIRLGATEHPPKSEDGRAAVPEPGDGAAIGQATVAAEPPGEPPAELMAVAKAGSRPPLAEALALVEECEAILRRLVPLAG